MPKQAMLFNCMKSDLPNSPADDIRYPDDDALKWPFECMGWGSIFASACTLYIKLMDSSHAVMLRSGAVRKFKPNEYVYPVTFNITVDYYSEEDLPDAKSE